MTSIMVTPETGLTFLGETFKVHRMEMLHRYHTTAPGLVFVGADRNDHTVYDVETRTIEAHDLDHGLPLARYRVEIERAREGQILLVGVSPS